MAITIQSLQARLVADQEALEADIEAVIKDLEIFLSRNLPRVLKEASTLGTDPATALNRLIDSFRNAGLGEQLGNIAEIYGNELRRVRDSAISEGLMTLEQFQASIDIDTVEALIRYRVEDIQNKAVQTIGELRPLIIENIILGTTPNLALLADTTSTALLNFTRTELNTALLGFNRMVHLVQAESVGIEKFIYIGPYDGVTRPFCRKILTFKSPPIYTAEEIKTMDNDQGLPVSIYGGGYNCRHRWRALPPDLAKRLENGNND
jgi:hypothetical protein